MSNVQVSTSFIQGAKHGEKSVRFAPIQPSQIASVLDSHGFDLVHLKTANAKKADRQDFQTTVARYRSRDGFAVDGLGFDLIFKIPHLYGSLQGVLGLFRGTCANQLNVGTHFESIKVKHLGTPMGELNSLIPQLVAQREKLVETVKSMQARDVSPTEVVTLAKELAGVRLENTENALNLQIADLIKVRRQDDAKNDLFSVVNVIQENLIRYGMRYQVQSTDQNGVNSLSNRRTRPIKSESIAAITLNASIWDAASKLLEVA